MLDDGRLKELAEDIKKNGLRESIKTHRGLILDGRNRFVACKSIGIEPRYKALPENIDPFAYVWSLNGERRDITDDQRYLIWKSCTEKSEEWKTEQRCIQDEANRKRSEAARAQPRTETGTFEPVVEQLVPVPAIHKTRQAKAAASKTNRGAVERMDRLTRDRPDLAEKVKIGELKSAEALRQMKKEQVAEKVKELPPGKYRVIYADPPWEYNDKLSGEISANYGAAEKHYPSMNLGELKALDIKKLCFENAVLFLWATSPLLPESLDLAKSWGFKYKASFVWDKVRHNMGHYNSVRHEFLLVCTMGNCTPDVMKLFDSVQSIEKTRRHSEKPEIFRQIIDTIYPYGPRIELFRRGSAPMNWDIWGNEIK